MPKKNFRADRPVGRGKQGKGYRLHDRRLAFSAERVDKAGTADAIRTIKFPLVARAGGPTVEQLAEDIRRDSLSLYGPLNFSDWLLDHRSSDGGTYSFLDFWLDALCLGGVFQQSDRDLRDLAIALTGVAPEQQFLSACSDFLLPGLFENVEPAGLYKFVTISFRQTKGADIGKKVDRIFKAEWVKANPNAPMLLALRDGCRHLAPLLEQRSDVERAIDKLKLVCHNLDDDTCLRLLSSYLQVDSKGPTTVVANDSTSKEDKLTFLFLPQLQRQDIAPTNALLRGPRLEQVLSGIHASPLREWSLKSLLALDSNFNALSHFGGDFIRKLVGETGVHDVLASMQSRYPYTESEVEEIRTRITILQRQARRLTITPTLALNLGYYRSELGGKLSSWLSNRENYEERMKESVGGLRTALTARRLEIDQKLGVNSGVQNQPKLERLASQTEELLTLLAALERHSQDGTLLSLESKRIYDETNNLLSDFNSDWNQYLQSLESSPSDDQVDTPQPGNQRKGKPKKKSKPSESNPDSRLSLPKFPSFFGDERRLAFAKLAEAPQLLQRIRQSFARMIGKLEVAPAYYAFSPEERPRLLSRVLARAREVFALEKTCSISIDARLSSLKALPFNGDFYVNPHARKRRPLLQALPASEEAIGIIDGLKATILALLNRPLDVFIRGGESGPAEIRAIQTLLSCLIRTPEGVKRITPEATALAGIRVSASGMHAFPSLVMLVERLHAPSVSLIERLFTRMGSEASGLAALLSRALTFERYTIQSINGEQTDVFTTGHDDPQQKRFAIGLPRWPVTPGVADTPSNQFSTLFMKGNTQVRAHTDTKPHFEIRSSKYQVQFLRWAWQRPASKRSELSLGGSFLICERGLALTVAEGKLDVRQEGATRVFAALPFEFLATRRSAAPTLELHKRRVIGVDVGEYGLAYSIVESIPETDGRVELRCLASGVLGNGTHRALRDKVKRLKRRQRRGLFLAANTGVANARETLVGTYQNQLHDLVMDWRAKLIFESNISVFEAGGNRIKTVYDTVKRADSYTNNDAQQSHQKHLWGVKRPSTGAEVGAAMTSQTCSCCRRCYRDYVDSVNLEELTTGINSCRVLLDDCGHYVAHEVLIGGVRLRLFVPFSHRDNPLASSTRDRDVRISLGKMIKAYLRPPLWRIGKEKLPKNARLRRGNSAVFRCPFSDCNFVADADVQASFNVAARYFVQEQRKQRGEKSELSWTIDYLKFSSAPPQLERRFFGGGLGQRLSPT